MMPKRFMPVVVMASALSFAACGGGNDQTGGTAADTLGMPPAATTPAPMTDTMMPGMMGDTTMMRDTMMMPDTMGTMQDTMP